MNHHRTLRSLLVLTAVLGTAVAHAQSQSTSTPQHRHHHHHATAGQAQTSMTTPAGDERITPEQAAAAIDMVYRDSARSIDLSDPNAALFSCNCTVHP